MRGRSQNKKWETRGKVTSNSRLGKDCPKLKNKCKGKSMSDACVIERESDSSDSELCLVGHQTIVGFL